METKTYNEILGQNRKKIYQIYDYDYHNMEGVKYIAEKMVNNYLDLEVWETWITNPKSEKDYTFNIYVALEDYEIKVPSEMEKIAKQFDITKNMEDNIRNAIIDTMKDIIKDKIDHYDSFWLSIDGYYLDYKLYKCYGQSIKVVGRFRGVKVSLKLDKYHDVDIINSRCLPFRRK